MGIPIRGYYKERLTDGILDDIEANALALQFNDTITLLISIDNCGIEQELLSYYRKKVIDTTEVPMENIVISSTHTHQGPTATIDSKNELVREYTEFLGKRIADVAQFAISDLKEAKMGYGKGVAPNVAFIRRYVMKDGSIKTNPGVNNPNIDHALATPNETVKLVKIIRENADDIVMVNFGTHPDSVGGDYISADYMGYVCDILEKAVPGTKCMFLQGFQGDVNHVDVNRPEWDNPKTEAR